MTEPLTLREDPQQTRDLTCRTFTVRAESVDEETRSVEAVIATEDPVTVWDWARWEAIDEVLRMDGANVPAQVPMLANHDRFTLDAVYGSARGIKIDGADMTARMHFADDEDSDKAYRKVRDKHITDVSAGYRSTEYTDIDAGQSAVVKGKSYTAGQRRLRVTTRWELREVSLVPIGADKRSKIRADEPNTPKEFTVNPKLKAFLVSLGLRADATDQQASDFYNGLKAEDKARADAAAKATEGQRSDPPANPPAPTPAPTVPDVAAERAAAVTAERERVRQITEAAGTDVPAETLQRAIAQGWDLARANAEFLNAIRGARRPLEGAPAGHVRSHEGDCNLQALQGAMLLRSGGLLDHESYRTMQAVAIGIPQWLRVGINSDERQRAMEQAHRFADMSLVDVCREAIRLDGRQIPYGREEIVQRAFSGSALTQIFTTSVNANLLASYMSVGDTTGGWTQSTDVADFKTQDRPRINVGPGLAKLPRGGEADHASYSDLNESYKIARYASQFVIDEQDMIDDSMNAFADTPKRMGEAAGWLRPDLVYAILLANASLGATSTALFHADQDQGSGLGNLDTSVALTATNLAAGISRMALFVENTRPLNLRATHLLVPPTLGFKAREFVESAGILYGGDDEAVRGTKNVLQNLVEVVSDARLELGVTSPATGVTSSGSAANWFLACSYAHTIEVGYLRGTGRAPRVRPFTLTQGKYGMGWDINLDIGAKALDWKGLYQGQG